MVGRRSGETYRLGDPVTVKLVEAAPVAGALRFELVSEGRAEPRRRVRASIAARPGAEIPRARNNGRHDDARHLAARQSLGRAHDQIRARPSFPDSEPRDAATMMLIDRSGPSPRCCSAAATHGHKFMPGKFVFPGGRIEALDATMSAVSELHPDMPAKLNERVADAEPAIRARAWP